MTKNCFIFDELSDHTTSLTRLCEAKGFAVNSCADLATAQAYLADELLHIDVAFIALDAPGNGSLSLINTPALRFAETMVMANTDIPARIRTAMEQGACYFFPKPFDPEFLESILNDTSIQVRADSNANTNACARHRIDQFGYLRGSSPVMRELYRMLRKVAASDLSLFVSGESGTGKELVARTAHALSDRSDGPFIAVNCAAIAETLIESELFGHEKGSFSGADKRHLGFFELAQGGTLLLDEITEMSPALQAKLLRVLESRQVRRVGSESDIEIDVRIISTTNRMPAKAVAAGTLREDLYFRLAQINVSVPPLRMRGEDTSGLAQHFLHELNMLHSSSKIFDCEAMKTLNTNHWPGNVRQLRHVVERAYILSGATLGTEFLPQGEPHGRSRLCSSDSLEVSLDETLAESERRIIVATLKKQNGDKQAAAQLLGISLKTLYNRLKIYGETTQPRVELAS